MSEEKTNFLDSDLADAVGVSMICLCILLGIGGCNYLYQKGEAEYQKSKQPLTTEEVVVE